MKRAKKKKLVADIDCQSGCAIIETPPWKRYKTREQAYANGFRSGYEKGRKAAQEEQSEKEKQINNEERRIRMQALTNICQTGSIVIEGMSKALMSFNRNL